MPSPYVLVGETIDPAGNTARWLVAGKSNLER